jgi:hypothetical protein
MPLGMPSGHWSRADSAGPRSWGSGGEPGWCVDTRNFAEGQRDQARAFMECSNKSVGQKAGRRDMQLLGVDLGSLSCDAVLWLTEEFCLVSCAPGTQS